MNPIQTNPVQPTAYAGISNTRAQQGSPVYFGGHQCDHHHDEVHLSGKQDEKQSSGADKAKRILAQSIKPAVKLAIAGGLGAAAAGMIATIVGTPLGIAAGVGAAVFALWAVMDVVKALRGGQAAAPEESAEAESGTESSAEGAVESEVESSAEASDEAATDQAGTAEAVSETAAGTDVESGVEVSAAETAETVSGESTAAQTFKMSELAQLIREQLPSVSTADVIYAWNQLHPTSNPISDKATAKRVQATPDEVALLYRKLQELKGGNA